MPETSRIETKIQGRIDPAIKSDLKTLAETEGLSLGAFVTKILTMYWTSKKRKGQC